ncbi:hypothetical protein Zmor_015072 [Zophobas morio]|uniref:Uncharacterized protein n=1 Tax=Zophobas morio TaxID=2755281 RepID=A0AA38IGL0_9CUCU|nr:hypothetical protein Zmor_015072 [Zophobas morio]
MSSTPPVSKYGPVHAIYSRGRIKQQFPRSGNAPGPVYRLRIAIKHAVRLRTTLAAMILHATNHLLTDSVASRFVLLCRPVFITYPHPEDLRRSTPV